MMSPAFDGMRLRRGAALVEVVISLLLIGVAVSAIMGTMLSTSLQSGPAGRIQNQEQAALCLNQLLQELKNYVTADYTTSNPDAPGGAGAAGWTLPEDTCSGLGSNCWALAPGTHNLDVTKAPPACAQNGATMTYAVQVVTVNGLDTRQVTATLTWTPQ